MTPPDKPRLLIFIVAYFAEATILEVLRRIPDLDGYDVEVLLIDDCSTDQTFHLSEQLSRSGNYKYPMTVLSNAVNQGYGGNQKIGYHYAVEKGFDLVALLHGDGQYAPEMLPRLLEPFAAGKADVVLGSRFLVPLDALRGGMPMYKFVGNRILTWYQNRILRSRLSEFHTGYKIYTTAALRRIPFELNSNVFHFDTEIIIQLLRANAGLRRFPFRPSTATRFPGSTGCATPRTWSTPQLSPGSRTTDSFTGAISRSAHPMPATTTIGPSSILSAPTRKRSRKRPPDPS